MRMLKIYLLEAKYEFFKVMRVPAFVVPTVLFPLIFYVFFGVALGHQRVPGSVLLGQYLIATYGTFGVMGASLFGFGVYVAVERGQGWLQVKRTFIPLRRAPGSVGDPMTRKENRGARARAGDVVNV